MYGLCCAIDIANIDKITVYVQRSTGNSQIPLRYRSLDRGTEEALSDYETSRRSRRTEEETTRG
jgi:hypothetical protein